MPLMLQCLNIMKTNAYIVHREKTDGTPLSHKQFILELCDSLCKREFGHNLRNNSNILPTPGAQTPTYKRIKISKSNPKLPSRRLIQPMTLHSCVLREQKRKCIYCRFLRMQAVESGQPQLLICQSRRACSFCDVHLCTDHFTLYHEG